VTEPPRRPQLKDALHLAEAVRLVWRAAPGWTALNALLAVLQGVIPLLSIYLMKLIVDAVTQGVTEADHEAAFRQTAALIAVAAVVGLAAAGLRSLAGLTSEALGQTVTDHVSDLIHAKSVAVDLEYYEDPAYYDTLQRAQTEAPSRPTRIVSDLLQTGQSAISMVSMAVLLFTLHWSVGLIVVVAAIPGAWVRMRYSRRMYHWQRERTSTERQAWYAHWLITGGPHAKEVRLFGLGELFRALYRDLRTVLRRERIDIARQTIYGSITLGSMVMHYQAFQQGLTSLQSVLQGIAGLYEDNLFLTYYHEFMGLEPKVVAPADPEPVPRPMREGVVFRDVQFRYAGTERTALQDIDLVIRPGEVAALVGPNGSGKTTLVKLLCRLYDRTGGSITLDGVDIDRFDVVDLRRQMSVIFQDFSQYQQTASENIRVGNIELPADAPETRAAVEAAPPRRPPRSPAGTRSRVRGPGAPPALPGRRRGGGA
jgi:ATP-binding cassette subfamily B protein